MSDAYRRVLVKLSGEALIAPDGYWLDPQTLAALAARPGQRGQRAASRSRWSSAAATSSAAPHERRRLDRPRHRRLHGHARDRHELARARDGARTRRASRRAPCRRSPCRRSARPMPASRRCTTSTRGRWSCSPAAPAIRSSPPTPPPCCAPPSCDCDAVLKATQVDGVYSADPKKDPDAVRYDRLTHDEAIAARPEGDGHGGVRAGAREPHADHRRLGRTAPSDRVDAAHPATGRVPEATVVAP